MNLKSIKSAIGVALLCGIPAAHAQLPALTARIANAGIGPFSSGLGAVSGLFQATSGLGLNRLAPVLAIDFVRGSNLLDPGVQLVTGITSRGYGVFTTVLYPFVPLTGRLPGLQQVEKLLP